jgi:hypothetical protein
MTREGGAAMTRTIELANGEDFVLDHGTAYWVKAGSPGFEADFVGTFDADYAHESKVFFATEDGGKVIIEQVFITSIIREEDLINGEEPR